MRAVRVGRGRTQSDAARKRGVSRATVVKWERGGLPTAVGDVFSIARWGGVDALDVFRLVASERPLAAA